jgi:FAD/FMN-containing dehydrogenase
MFAWLLLTLPLSILCANDLRDCLVKAVDDDAGRVAWKTKFLFEVTDVHRYNLRYNTKPLAITYPKTPQEVAEIVKCAAADDVAVQARSGGHSFGNYGMPLPPRECVLHLDFCQVSAETMAP